jgi:hypothetical protein
MSTPLSLDSGESTATESKVYKFVISKDVGGIDKDVSNENVEFLSIKELGIVIGNLMKYWDSEKQKQQSYLSESCKKEKLNNNWYLLQQEREERKEFLKEQQLQNYSTDNYYSQILHFLINIRMNLIAEKLEK